MRELKKQNDLLEEKNMILDDLLEEKRRSSGNNNKPSLFVSLLSGSIFGFGISIF